jgi:hypothetical protein
VSATVTATGPFHLFGWGPDAKVVATAATFNVFELSAANSGSVLENFTIHGAATNDSTTQFGISHPQPSTPSASRVTVRGVRFVPDASDKALNCGIKVYQANDWLISDIYVENLWGQELTNTGYGVLTGRSRRIHVADSIFRATTNRGRHAVYMTVAACDNTIANVTAIGYKRCALIFKAGPTGESCDRNLITGCKVLDYGANVADQAAIAIGGAGKSNRIEGCTIDGSADEAITILPGDFTVVAGFTPGALADNVIEGCTITNCVGQAVELQSTTRTQITNCRIHNVGTGGATAAIGVRGDGNFGQGNDTGLHVQGCYITSPGRASVEVSTSGATPPSGVVITGNDVTTGSTGDAIRDLTRPGVWDLHNIIDGDATKVKTAPVNATAPSVRGTRILIIVGPSPAVATTLTALNDGVEGQTVEVHFRTGFYTVDFSGTTLKGNGGVDWVPANLDKMVCTKQGANWYCSFHDCSP